MTEHGIKDPGGVQFNPGSDFEMLYSAVDHESCISKSTPQLPAVKGRVANHVPISSYSLENFQNSARSDPAKLVSASSPLSGIVGPEGSLMYPMFPIPGHAMLPTPGSILSSAMLSMGPGTDEILNLRCIACGLVCKSTLDLHQHIMRKHLNSDSIGECSKLNVPFDAPVKIVGSEYGAKQNSGSSSDSDVSLKQLPLVAPRFPLFPPNLPTTGALANPLLSKTLSAVSERRENFLINKATSHLTSHLKGDHPQGQSSFRQLNPFLSLAYPNIMSNSTTYTPVSSVVPTPMSLMNPYFGYPGTPGNGLLPNQFPCIPGLPMMVNHIPSGNGANNAKFSLGIKVPLLGSDSIQTNQMPCDSNGYSPSSEKQGYVETASQQNRHAELLQRRMSAPLIGLNKDFSYLHPYSRLGKGPSASRFNAVVEKSEPTDNNFAVKNGHKIRRESVPDKTSTSRLNAKSIEQHISKLISNNEKVLLNPVLERVKPRRVFRRNSLDPASLSSCSSVLSSKSDAEGLSLGLMDVDLKSTNKQLGSNGPVSGLCQGLQADQMQVPPGMTTMEYKKMILLTRAPRYGYEALNALLDDQEIVGLNPQSGHDSSTSNSFLGKRSHSTTVAPNLQKKNRRTTFFECNDCGVRYRKEENYVIHKKVYCKYRKEGNFSQNHHKNIFESNHFVTQEATVECAIRQSVLHHNPDAQAQLLSSHALPTIQTASHSGGRYTKIVPSFPNDKHFSDPITLVHQDLCRTKSADAALQSESTSVDLPKVEEKQSESKTQCGGTFDAQSKSDTRGLVNNIPTNKLPPNKRHMHLMRHSDASKEKHSDANILTVSQSLDKSSLSQPSYDNSATVLRNDTRPAFSFANNIAKSTGFSSDMSDFNEMSVPRSNYKLLLHQISLRNMQDIEFLGDTNGVTKSHAPRRVSMGQTALQNNNRSDRKAVKHNRSFSTSIPPCSANLVVPFQFKHSTTDADVPRHVRFTPRTEGDNMMESANASKNDCQLMSIVPELTRNENVKGQCRLDELQIKQNSPSPMQRSFTGGQLRIDDSKHLEEDTQIFPPVVTSTFLFPHMQPSVACRSHVTFCCVLNTQPAYVELPKEPKEGGKSCLQHMSMYSQWATSDPILVPSDLSVTDLLNGWRRSSQSDYVRKGIFVNTRGSSDLICTDNKSYEKEMSKRRETGDHTSPDKVRIPPQADSYADQLLPTVPVSGPPFLTSSAAAIYASCVDCRSQVFGISSPISTASQPTPCLDVSSSTAASHRLKDSDARRASHTRPDCALSQSDSSSSPSTLFPKVTKIRRRKSRKDRSAASPREQRRSLCSQSPSSPCLQAVHHGKTNSSDAEERLRGCALCSIKAGRSDLIRDVNSACKPCRESNGHHTTIARCSKSGDGSTSITKNAHYTSPPAQFSTYLDRTRASTGSTQHWVSTIAQESSYNVFRYPSPNSNRSSVSEKGNGDGVNLGMNEQNWTDAASDVERPGDGLNTAVSPSLAEVVSEVMRTAAMQSKRHASSRKKHPLAGSRALHISVLNSPGEYVLPWTCSKALASNHSDKPWLTSDGSEPPEKKVKLLSSKKLAIDRSEACDIVLTPATPTDEQAGIGDSLFNGSPTTIAEDGSKVDERSLVSPHEAHGTAAAVKSNPTDAAHIPLNSLQEKITSLVYFQENAPTSPRQQCASRLASKLGATSGDESADEASSEGEAVAEESDCCQATSSVARTYRCDECKVAFRIGGHLAKHLRSKGHTIAMQKKTLNRLKQHQHRISMTSSSLTNSSDLNQTKQIGGGVAHVNGLETNLSPGSEQKSQSCEMLSGTEVLARSQVKALFEGNEEYACVPSVTSDDVFSVNVNADELGSAQDPRPFKCIACRVAFRFQGHLDRHFRSNLHLIAVGHYEQVDLVSTNSKVTENIANHQPSFSRAELLAQSGDDEHASIKTGALMRSQSFHEKNRNSSSSDQDVEVVAVSSEGDEEIGPVKNNRQANLANCLTSSVPCQVPQGGAVALDRRSHEHRPLPRYHPESHVSTPPTSGEMLSERNLAADEGVSMRVSEPAVHAVAVPL